MDKIKEKVESKWVDELTDEAGYFHQYSEWQRIIQGGKNEEKPKEEEEGKEKKEKNRLQRAVMIKACGKVSSKVCTPLVATRFAVQLDPWNFP